MILKGILNYKKKKGMEEIPTFREKKVWVTLSITEGKCLDNSINLLGFVREAYFHEQLPQCNVEGNAKKVELIDI